jgi:histone H3/H4
LARELLVVESKVRQLLPEGIRLSSDALEGLNDLVKQAIDKAVKRCQANGRKTIIKEDF